MSKRVKLRELQVACEKAGFYVDTYSPGDGVTRYRFSSKPAGYFASNGDYTALGMREAVAYARGRGAWA